MSGRLVLLDRIVIAYLALPLLIFILGWLVPLAALPLSMALLFALAPLARPSQTVEPPDGLVRRLWPMAIGAGVLWAVLGGTGHWVYANRDWIVRDAVLHDLVVTRWPVGYGDLQGLGTMLRAPLAFYMPAALIGKVLGLMAAHTAMAAWTAAGASLFLMQVLSLMPPRRGAALAAVVVVIFFSGFDVLGCMINDSRFFADWRITNHLEWWAGAYQYSSMTTQMFWVPNHALGGWLTIGLLCRHAKDERLDVMLPIVLVADLFGRRYRHSGCCRSSPCITASG